MIVGDELGRDKFAFPLCFSLRVIGLWVNASLVTMPREEWVFKTSNLIFTNFVNVSGKLINTEIVKQFVQLTGRSLLPRPRIMI